MSRHPRLTFALALAGGLAWLAPAPAAPPPRLATVPAGAVLALDLHRPGDVLDLLTSPAVLDAVKNSPQYKAAADSDGLKGLQQGVKVIEGALNADWPTALRRVTAGGATVAVDAAGGTLLVLDVDDEVTGRQVRDLLLLIARGDGKDKSATPWKRYAGQVQWSLGPTGFLVLSGRRVWVANQEPILHAALDLHAGRGEGLAAKPAYLQGRKSLGEPGTGTLFVDLATLKMAPGAKAALDGLGDPWLSLLFGSVTEAVKESGWMAANLRVDKGGRIALDAAFDRAGGSDLFAFTHPRGKDGALPPLAVPRQIASLSLYRDLKDFYTAKDKLFPERTSALIFFENMMGIFFSGRQLTDEVFAEFHPEYRLVAAAHEFDPAGATPEVKLPGFAMVIRLRHPADFKETMEEAWQKMIGLVAFSIGQKGQSGLIMDRDFHEGVKYQVARFTAPRGVDKTKLPVQYNFRPALVLADDWCAITSTEALAKDLIVALKKEKAAPAAGVNTLAEFDGPKLAAVLASNRTSLVLQSMTEKGNSKEQAEAETDFLLSLLQVIGRAKAALDVRDGRPHASLALTLNLP